jgi:hypothetical protein
MQAGLVTVLFVHIRSNSMYPNKTNFLKLEHISGLITSRLIVTIKIV